MKTKLLILFLSFTLISLCWGKDYRNNYNLLHPLTCNCNDPYAIHNGQYEIWEKLKSLEARLEKLEKEDSYDLKDLRDDLLNDLNSNIQRP